MVTVGDNGYPNGNQVNYGDLQQTGKNTSAIFGPSFWTVPSSTMPIFTAAGNHGLSGPAHTDITTWTQKTAVSTSDGRYQDDVYCCVNGTKSAHYASEWYAFTAGNARFYVLDAAWGDSNKGTATPYADDYAAHWTPSSPEYQWLAKDLASHPTQLKFAFYHYPLYVDNPTESPDTYLQGPNSLEGLLADNGVQMAFNGHAHLYQRNTPSAPGMPVTYVTGGGGGTLEPVGPCTSQDAYGVGWSPTKLKGYACGAASPPTSAAQVYHFLKVTVSGATVTVAPTDSNGNTFDVQSYKFADPLDTWIQSGPNGNTQSTSASFTFTGTSNAQGFVCSLDGSPATSCTSPQSYSGLSDGDHTFTVAAVNGTQTDTSPASRTWTVDTTPPSAPTGMSAQAASDLEVDLSWTAASDAQGVTGYKVYRDGNVIGNTPGLTYSDTSVSGGTQYSYTVSAVDAAGNESAQSAAATVTTPAGSAPVFSDGFESGDLKAWDRSGGLTPEDSNVNSGVWAVEGNTTNGGTYAKKTLSATYPDAYAQIHFDLLSEASQVNLLRLRTAGGASLGYVYVDSSGRLGVHNDTGGKNTRSAVVVGPGWHALQLRIRADDTAGTATGALQVWLDGTLVGDISSTAVDVGATPVGGVQIGETQTGRTYDVVLDDVAVATGRLGADWTATSTGSGGSGTGTPVVDTTAPTAPTGLSGQAVSDVEVDLSWTAATDDQGVTGYRVYRNGNLVGSPGGLTYADKTVSPGSTYKYTVTAVDAAGNESSPSTPASVSTPQGSAPVFGDDFETGGLSAWDASAGLSAESSNVNTGSWAVEGNTTNGATYAKKALSTTYPDVYAQAHVNLISQNDQVNLLRLRTAGGASLGYVYVNKSGRLGVHNDTTGTNTLSTTVLPAGWHAVQLRMAADTSPGTATGALQVWLDDALVADISSTSVDVGSTPAGGVQIGETQTGRTYDVVLDDVAVATSRLAAR
jgi:chitodextrinase